ncbi:MAG: AAA family ATPase [Candidatus Saccharimonadales bacterium]
MIIGLSGTFASGKDTLAHHLVQTRNYMHLSTSDMVRAVAEAQYGSIERPVLKQTANELRDKRGPGVLAELSLEKYNEEKDKYDGVVISGVRSLGEVEAIKKAGGKIVFIDAPAELRYERIKARHRSNEDKLTFEEFKTSEESEELSVHDNPYVQDLTGVRELADVIVFNQDDVQAYLSVAEQKIGF